jgi:hypothetical protein
MIKLVTYADLNMNISQSLCVSSALKNGVDDAVAMTPDNVSEEFKQFNPVFYAERGSGYWIWKPYAIYKTILNLNEGDILIYSDAGVEFVAPVQEIINRMDEDIFFFTNGFPHVEWCKGDVSNAINKYMIAYGDNDDDFTWVDGKCYCYNFKQVQASVIFFKVNQKTRDFVKEWLLYSQMPGFIDDSPSVAPNYPTFAEHRHDQAILTCLQIKYGYKLHWWPTQYSNHLPRIQEDSYPVIFNHHRKRNNEW